MQVTAVLSHAVMTVLPHLKAVDGEPPPRLIRPVLQLGDDAVVHIFLLFPQEVRGDSIQGIAGELVVPGDGCEQVELHPAVYGDVLVVPSAVRLAAELRIPHLGPPA